jgi:hypothetical protein
MEWGALNNYSLWYLTFLFFVCTINLLKHPRGLEPPTLPPSHKYVGGGAIWPKDHWLGYLEFIIMNRGVPS